MISDDWPFHQFWTPTAFLTLRMWLVFNCLESEKYVVEPNAEKSKHSIKTMHCEIPIKTVIWLNDKIKAKVDYFSFLFTNISQWQGSTLASTCLSAALCFFGFRNSVPSSVSISQALSHCLNHQCRFSLAFYLWPSFFLISTLYPLMTLSTLPAQTALLVNDFPNLYIQLQTSPQCSNFMCSLPLRNFPASVVYWLLEGYCHLLGTQVQTFIITSSQLPSSACPGLTVSHHFSSPCWEPWFRPLSLPQGSSPTLQFILQWLTNDVSCYTVLILVLPSSESSIIPTQHHHKW